MRFRQLPLGKGATIADKNACIQVARNKRSDWQVDK